MPLDYAHEAKKLAAIIQKYNIEGDSLFVS
jgi:hypothetical protein